MQKMRRSYFVMLIVIVIGVAIGGFVLSAQTFNTTPQEVSPPSFLETNQLDASQGVPPPSLMNNPESYSVVYLIDPNSSSENEFLSPKGLLSTMANAEVFHSMDALLSFNSMNFIDALIIHSSASSWLDTSWVTSVKQQGTVIATIDLGITQFAQLLGSDCYRENASTLRSRFEVSANNHYYMISELVQAESPQEGNLVRNSLDIDCARISGPAPISVDGLVHVTLSASDGPLNNTDDMVKFLNNMFDSAFNIRSAQIQWNERNLPPDQKSEFSEIINMIEGER